MWCLMQILCKIYNFCGYLFEIFFCFSAFLTFFHRILYLRMRRNGKIPNVWNIPDYLVSIYGG